MRTPEIDQMKPFLAFIISAAAFGALFLLMDIMLLNAQGLSFIFKG